ncbi:hypothetical protein FRC09_012232 [Ceratobasidium sp. 395]|nr:hypothetical protein FRC09_012232 [Ceratobasidium sp. 395]
MLAARIRDAYNFIAQNYAEGDQICIFGFSRGAYTARKLSGLIERLGLLSPAEMGHFFTYWKQLNDVRSGEPPRPAKPVPIKCVGTWDTVGSVDDGSGPKIDALRLKDSNMPPNVEIALHAVSFHENRCKFPCMLYTGLTSPSQTLKQVWFPGAHADVGGGYAQHELADISLAWMVGEIESFVGVDHTFVESLISTNAEKRPWGESVPRDAYATTPGIIRRWVLGQKSRLPFLTSDSKFHPSLLVSPDTEKLLTISNLKEQMPGWNPEEHVVELNNFERRVKEIWHDVPRDGKEPPKVEGSEDLESMFELAPLVDWLLILLDKVRQMSTRDLGHPKLRQPLILGSVSFRD